MTISKLTAFNAVPPFAQGLVRDLRVRWALEEAGLPYTSVLVDPADRLAAPNVDRNPFGQVPALERDGGWAFESGAILYRLGLRSDHLLPTDEEGRAQTLTWMFAALNTVEPAVEEVFNLNHPRKDEPWAALKAPSASELAARRIAVVGRRLADRTFLVDRFTIADILMATVLRFVADTDLLQAEPHVLNYLRTCEARPAFQRALARQMSDLDCAQAA